MDANGQLTNGVADVLRWPRRVLAADDLRRALQGHREVLVSREAVVTPLAIEELRSKGVGIIRESATPATTERTWGQTQERPFPLVQSAIQAVQREGVQVTELPKNGGASVDHWARAVAECVARGECCGGVIFCVDPGLVCCVANKLAGLRAVPVVTVGQAARATLTLGANLLAVEMPGRTFFEIRQVLRLLCGCDGPNCPPGVEATLRELENHAHR